MFAETITVGTGVVGVLILVLIVLAIVYFAKRV